MADSRVAIFSGPTATISNSPTLVTSNKARREGERVVPGRFDHLVAQRLAEPVTVRIKKFSAHPLEEDARAVYQDDGDDFSEVELRPEDGPYLLPYLGRRADGSPDGAPFEDQDFLDATMAYGGRQTFYPDASQIFEDIDRTIGGRDEHGEGNTLERMADFDFIRVLPSGGYVDKGERSGVDYFPYRPFPVSKRPRYRDLARAANQVQAAMSSGKYLGGIWLEGSPVIEESLYWLSLLIDTDLPIAGNAAQRTHGQLSNDGDRNIIDAVGYVLSGRGHGLGAVGVQDEQIFAAREFKKADDRPGNYKATGGHGGILGSVGPPVTVWYLPAYKHTARSEVNLTRLSAEVEFDDRPGIVSRIRIKTADGALDEEVIPRVHIVKYGSYMDEDETDNPDHDVDILAKIEQGLQQEANPSGPGSPFHGFVLEGTSPYGNGSGSQQAALAIAAFSGMPVVRVGRADPGGLVPGDRNDLTVAGSNLDTNKARLLLIASMLKLGRLPKAADPRNPTPQERNAVIARLRQFQEIFDTH
jgi:L-asparaginase/Glu-tRNA(Gln) amidotransferase subunit D